MLPGFPLWADALSRAPENVQIDALWAEYVQACQQIVLTVEEDQQASRGAVASMMARALIDTLFGEDWVEENLAEARSYALTGDDPQVKRAYLHEEMQLGRYLFDLQSFDFYPDLIADLKNRHSELRGAMFEAEVVWLLKFIPLRARIRIPTGMKTDDYDIGVSFADSEWAIEVKAKNDAAFSAKSLKNTLDVARTQLPPGGLGTIFVRVPRPWGQPDAYESEAEAVIVDRLRSGRLHAIVLISDVWLTKIGQRFQTPKLTAHIYYSTKCDGDIRQLLEMYGRLWNGDPAIFHPIWSRVI